MGSDVERGEERSGEREEQGRATTGRKEMGEGGGRSFRGERRKREEGATELTQRDPRVRHRPPHGARQMASVHVQTTTLKALVNMGRREYIRSNLVLLYLFINIRCFYFMKHIYLDIF
jgi:hypothetical protein